jgi:peroxiredoxin Q/BCP
LHEAGVLAARQHRRRSRKRARRPRGFHAGTESHQAFTKKYNLNFPLLADTDGKVGRAYGVLRRRRPHGEAQVGRGMADRVTFVIGADGRIANVIEKPDVGHHAEEVIDLL